MAVECLRDAERSRSKQMEAGNRCYAGGFGCCTTSIHSFATPTASPPGPVQRSSSLVENKFHVPQLGPIYATPAPIEANGQAGLVSVSARHLVAGRVR